MSSNCNITRESSEATICAVDAARGLGDASSLGSEAAALALEMEVAAAEQGDTTYVVLPRVDSGQDFPSELGHAEENGRGGPSFSCDTCVIFICAFFMLSVVGLCIALVIWVFLRGLSTL